MSIRMGLGQYIMRTPWRLQDHLFLLFFYGSHTQVQTPRPESGIIEIWKMSPKPISYLEVLGTVLGSRYWRRSWSVRINHQNLTSLNCSHFTECPLHLKNLEKWLPLEKSRNFVIFNKNDWKWHKTRPPASFLGAGTINHLWIAEIG